MESTIEGRRYASREMVTIANPALAVFVFFVSIAELALTIAVWRIPSTSVKVPFGPEIVDNVCLFGGAAFMIGLGLYLASRYSRRLCVTEHSVALDRFWGGSIRRYSVADIKSVKTGRWPDKPDALRVEFRDGTCIIVDRYFRNARALHEWLASNGLAPTPPSPIGA